MLQLSLQNNADTMRYQITDLAGITGGLIPYSHP